MSVINNSSPASGKHDAVLQRLDTDLGTDDDKTRYPADVMPDGMWENIPLIWSPTGDHPINESQLPEGMKVAGAVTKSWLAQEGEPRVLAELEITDKEIDELANQGAISLSTSMDVESAVNEEGVRVMQAVHPRHVLLFPRGGAGGVMPRDRGAYICNTAPRRVTGEAELTTVNNTEETKLTKANNAEPEPVKTDEPAPQEEVVEANAAETAANIASMAPEEQIAALTATVAVLAENHATDEECEQIAEIADSLVQEAPAEEVPAENAEEPASEEAPAEADGGDMQIIIDMLQQILERLTPEEKKEEAPAEENSEQPKEEENSKQQKSRINNTTASGYTAAPAQQAPRTKAEMMGFRFK